MRCLILSAFFILQVNCGFLDWFKSKPAWVAKIDREPLIEAFKPHGLRVSISDIEGMTAFGFHGKLNECFGRNEVPTIEYEVMEPVNGRWVYINENIQLQEGDALHYWISVKVGVEEQKFSKKVQIIKNLIPKPTHLSIDVRLINDGGTTAVSDKNNGLCPCHDTTISDWKQPNVEQIVCQYQIDSLTELALHLLKGSDENKKLVLTGKEPFDTSLNSIQQLQRILSALELYDLGDKIKIAEYTNCGILFEMSSIIDKKRIQLRASNDLQHSSSYQFNDPDQSPCIT